MNEMNDTRQETPDEQYARLSGLRNKGRDNGYQPGRDCRINVVAKGDTKQHSGNDLGAMAFGELGDECSSAISILREQHKWDDDKVFAEILGITDDQVRTIEENIPKIGIYGAIRLACGIEKRVASYTTHPAL